MPHPRPELPTTATEQLNRLLADETVLLTKTRNFHWNIEGPNFHSLHALFDHQYTELSEMLDAIAERIRQLGGYPAGSLAEYLRLTQLPESPGGALPEQEMIHHLLRDHETLAATLRKSLENPADTLDPGTEDEMTAWLKTHEKMAWMLRAHQAV